LIREKGAQDFLALCREISRDSLVHFLVVGDPDPGNPTSLTVQEMSVLEAVPHLHREAWMQDVRPAYAAMDVLVFLSAREGLPVSPQEAMAMGVPVVAYDAVGTRDVVPQKWIVERGHFAILRKGELELESARAYVNNYERMVVQKKFLNTITLRS